MTYANLKFGAILLAGAASAALLVPAQPAKAYDCLLDTNNDGTATAGTDTAARNWDAIEAKL